MLLGDVVDGITYRTYRSLQPSHYLIYSLGSSMVPSPRCLRVCVRGASGIYGQNIGEGTEERRMLSSHFSPAFVCRPRGRLLIVSIVNDFDVRSRVTAKNNKVGGALALSAKLTR
jgi:hypothetical protein